MSCVLYLYSTRNWLTTEQRLSRVLVRMHNGHPNLLIMVSLDRFLQFAISSSNKFQSLMEAGKKEYLKMSVLQMGSLSY